MTMLYPEDEFLDEEDYTTEDDGETATSEEILLLFELEGLERDLNSL